MLLPPSQRGKVGMGVLVAVTRRPRLAPCLLRNQLNNRNRLRFDILPGEGDGGVQAIAMEFDLVGVVGAAGMPRMPGPGNGVRFGFRAEAGDNPVARADLGVEGARREIERA